MKQNKEYYQKHKEEIIEYNKKRYQERREEVLEYKKQWREEHKEGVSEYNKQYYQQFKKELSEKQKKYRQEHKKEKAEYNKKYQQTPIGRANGLLRNYRYADKKAGRGECTLTAQWIVDNIFTKKCAHCPETDWMELGCNRLDNSLPHTPENVEPCCGSCNCKLGGRPKKIIYPCQLVGK